MKEYRKAKDSTVKNFLYSVGATGGGTTNYAQRKRKSSDLWNCFPDQKSLEKQRSKHPEVDLDTPDESCSDSDDGVETPPETDEETINKITALETRLDRLLATAQRQSPCLNYPEASLT